MKLEIIPFPAFFPKHSSGTEAFLILKEGDQIRLIGAKAPANKEINFSVRLDVDEKSGELIITCFEPVKIINQFEDKKK